MRILFVSVICSVCLWAKIGVVVSVAPQEYFIKAIAKDKVEVTIMVPPNMSPETFEPLPSQSKILLQAKVFFGVGMDYEHSWLQRFQSLNQNLEYINLAEILGSKDATHHTHDTHHHDPHIWVSLELAKSQAQIITQTLSRLDSANKAFYEQNLESFLAQIATMQRDFTRIFENLQTRTFIVMHPAFGYLAKEFGLEEIALEEDGKDVKLKRLNEITHIIQEKKIRFLFVQPQFDADRIDSIASRLKLKPIVLDPLNKDWATNMYDIAKKIAYE